MRVNSKHLKGLRVHEDNAIVQIDELEGYVYLAHFELDIEDADGVVVGHAVFNGDVRIPFNKISFRFDEETYSRARRWTAEDLEAERRALDDCFNR